MEVKKHLKILCLFFKKFKLKYNILIDISVKAIVQILYDVVLLMDLKMKMKSLKILVISKRDEKVTKI